MDTLENNVRSECKQAFAELQTDMTDLTMDLETSGIPLLDHRTFVMKVFFPGVGDHPLFLDPRIHGGVNKPRTELDNAMLQVRNAIKREREREIILTTFPLQFEGLLNNKWFLLAFIETMERQKSFTIRWRKTLNFFSSSKTDIVFPRQGPSELRLSCHRDPHVQDGVLHRYTQVGKIQIFST